MSEEIAQSPEIASLRSQARGDRGVVTLSFGGGLTASLVVPHKLKVDPGVVTAIVVLDPGVVVMLWRGTSDADTFTLRGRAAAVPIADPVVQWEARP